MKRSFLFFLTLINIVFFMVIYSKSINEELSANLLRFHIKANSNSEYDQKIKLEVRDFILNEINIDLNNKKDVKNNLKILEDNVNIYLSKKNIKYKATIINENVIFPMKTYNNISIPSGEYDTIQVLLGEGEGENWWCIAFPPLCFTEAVTGNISDTGRKYLNDTVSDEAFFVITNPKNEYKIKFKIVDFINRFIN